MTASDLTLSRSLPNSPESERAVLGTILLDEKAFSTAACRLSVCQSGGWERAGIKTLIEIRCWKEDQCGRSYFVVLQ